MRFFSLERYLRLGNLKFEPAFLAAQREWEQAVEEYQRHLAKVHPRLPSGLRRLIDSVYLHDAVVLDMWQGRASRLTVTLRPESDPSRLAILTYSLDSPPEVRHGVLPPAACSEPVAWLYDELDIARNAKRRPTFLHHILLSNGWEIRLRFHDVKVARPAALIPLTRLA